MKKRKNKKIEGKEVSWKEFLQDYWPYAIGLIIILTLSDYFK